MSWSLILFLMGTILMCQWSGLSSRQRLNQNLNCTSPETSIFLLAEWTATQWITKFFICQHLSQLANSHVLSGVNTANKLLKPQGNKTHSSEEDQKLNLLSVPQTTAQHKTWPKSVMFTLHVLHSKYTHFCSEKLKKCVRVHLRWFRIAIMCIIAMCFNSVFVLQQPATFFLTSEERLIHCYTFSQVLFSLLHWVLPSPRWNMASVPSARATRTLPFTCLK